MARPHDLNSAQLAVLRWVADGSPSGVMEGYSHRISAVALRSRGLVRIFGRGPTWRSEITPAGLACLEASNSESTEVRPRGERPMDPAPAVAETKGRRQPHSKPEDLLIPARPAPKISVPSTLRGAHRFVLATQDAAVGLEPGGDGRIQIGPRPGVAYTVVARANLNRALRVLQGVLREATRRGWDVVPYDRAGYDDHLGIAIELRGHRYPIELHEVTETIPFTEDEIVAWRTEWRYDIPRRAGRMPPPQLKRKRATGRLRLSLLVDTAVAGRTGLKAREVRSKTSFRRYSQRSRNAPITTTSKRPRPLDVQKSGGRSPNDERSSNVSHASRRLVKSAYSQKHRPGTKSSSRAGTSVRCAAGSPTCRKPSKNASPPGVTGVKAGSLRAIPS
jgi:hypothetical protein